MLRIIGCNLNPNDWDLVSLLFATMHGRESAAPYEIEVIGWPADAAKIATSFPYLNVKSILEIDKLGPLFITEILGIEETTYANLDEPQREQAHRNARDKIKNPFELWLRVKGEMMLTDPDRDGLGTERNLFKVFVEA